MGLSRFLKGGFDDASFVPDPADAQEEEFVDFALELEANLEGGNAGAPIQGGPEANNDVPVVDQNVPKTGGDGEARGNQEVNSSVPDVGVVRIPIPGDKRKSIAGIPLEGAPKRPRRDQEVGPSDGKPVKAKKKKSGLSVKDFQLRDEELVGGDRTTPATAVEKEVLKVDSSEDTRSVNAPIKEMRDLEFEDEISGLFVPPFLRVQHGSLLEDYDDRMDYVRNIMVPKKLQLAEDMTDENFLDFANQSLIEQITAQAEYLRRFSLASEHRYRLLRENARLRRRVEAFEQDAEHIRRGENFEDLQNQLAAKDKEVRDLQAEKGEVQGKFESMSLEVDKCNADLVTERKKVEDLLSTVASLEIEKSTLKGEISSLVGQMGQAKGDRRSLVEGIPGLVRRFLKSDEFNKEMGSVQELAMDAGGHRAMGRLRAKFGARLDVTRLEDYKPEAFAALISAGDQLAEKDFPFLTRLASGVDLSVTEFLRLEPEALPDDAT